MLLDEIQDRLPLLAPAPSTARGAPGSTRRLAALCLLIGIDRRKLTFDRFELLIDLRLLAKRFVAGLLEPRTLALDGGSKRFRVSGLGLADPPLQPGSSTV